LRLDVARLAIGGADLYRAEWISRGLSGAAASATAAPPPPPNFTRLYHLCGAAHALENIQKSRLKVSTFRESNDPFELSVFFSTDPAQQRRLDQFVDDVARRFGVVCFSDDWRDPVYWSHYAERHRGIALGFDVLEDDFVLQVEYVENRIEFPNREPEGRDVDIFLGTKFESWQYERERRIMLKLTDADQDGGFWFERFGPKMALREVVLAPLCHEDITAIRASVDAVHRDVRTYRARLAEEFFCVIPDERIVPARTP